MDNLSITNVSLKVLFQIKYVNMKILNIKQKKSYKKQHIHASSKSN